MAGAGAGGLTQWLATVQTVLRPLPLQQASIPPPTSAPGTLDADVTHSSPVPSTLLAGQVHASLPWPFIRFPSLSASLT